MACHGNNFMVLQDGTTYTFSQILELNLETEEILADLGYRYRSAPLSLHSVEVPCLAQQLEQMRERLPFVPLTNEAAFRAFYVTPLLFAVLDQVRFKMNIEYPVTGGRLKGAVDYLLRGRQELVVAGAKSGDLEGGFRMLAVQMVGLSEHAATPTVGPIHPRRARKAQRAGRARGGPSGRQFGEGAKAQLYGVVTSGPIWQFGLLERGQKRITKDTEDTEEYQLPRDLEQLVGILAGLLGESESEQEKSKREGEKLSWANN